METLPKPGFNFVVVVVVVVIIIVVHFCFQFFPCSLPPAQFFFKFPFTMVND